MALMSEIRWPVLRFGRPDCVVLKCESSADLTRATFISLPILNAMDEYFVVDSNGDVFELSEARPARTIGRLGRMVQRITNPTIEIEYGRIEKTRRLSLAELKDRLKADFAAEPSYWEEVDDLDRLRSRVDGCDSIEELMEIF